MNVKRLPFNLVGIPSPDIRFSEVPKIGTFDPGTNHNTLLANLLDM